MVGQIKESNTMDNLEITAPEKVSKQNDEMDLTSRQSANALFNFTRKFEWLTANLKKKAFLPRYNEENIEAFELGDEKEICFPMTYFCDIHLKRLGFHMEKYGDFGIGLEKEWGIKAGLQPIQYVNINSPLHKEFSNLFTRALRNIYQENDPISEYQNFLLTNLLYLKPLEGLMRISDADDGYATRNFHDEREWRYIPDLSGQEDLPLLLPKDHMSPQAYQNYSMGIGRYREFWLNYEYKDIKHLIVKDEKYREQLIHFVTHDLDIDMYEKMLLISKIIVWDNIKKDW